MAEGVITAAFGRQYYVTGDDGSTLVCVLRGKRSDATVGDRVDYIATGGGVGAIDRILARRTLLQRSDRRRVKLFAANLSQVAIVVAPDPPASEELLMRALIAAHEADLAAALILNKADLLAVEPSHGERAPGEAPSTGVAQRADLYESLGVPVFRVSAGHDRHATRSALLPWLRDQTTLLIGQSGMGKSTLINTLVPDAAMATQTISAALATGRHTTTFAKSFPLTEGGTIVDSPGFQEFGLAHLSLSQVQAALPDFEPYLGQCRFYNCTHRAEPGCAVRSAVEAGRIDSRRYALYTHLADELTRPQY